MKETVRDDNTLDTKVAREAAVITKTDEAFGRPVGSKMLTDDMRALGLAPRDVVIVHSSLSSIGWVPGEARTVIEALSEVVGPDGTLVMPTHTGHLSDPDHWEFPPVPESWKQIIRDEMPAFDLEKTMTRGMGAIPELFRTFPRVRRSYHPTASFAARGPEARFITGNQNLESGLGDGGPLARVYDLGGKVLLLGVGHDSNTSLHLAEHRAQWPGKKQYREGSPIYQEGCRIWQPYNELDFEDDDFVECGRAFEKSVIDSSDSREVSVGRIGLSECLLINQQSLVDFAVGWFSENRSKSTEEKTRQTRDT